MVVIDYKKEILMTVETFWENREQDIGRLVVINKDVRETEDGKINVRLAGTKSELDNMIAPYRSFKVPHSVEEDNGLHYIIANI